MKQIFCFVWLLVSNGNLSFMGFCGLDQVHNGKLFISIFVSLTNLVYLLCYYITTLH